MWDQEPRIIDCKKTPPLAAENKLAQLAARPGVSYKCRSRSTLGSYISAIIQKAADLTSRNYGKKRALQRRVDRIVGLAQSRA